MCGSTAEAQKTRWATGKCFAAIRRWCDARWKGMAGKLKIALLSSGVGGCALERMARENYVAVIRRWWVCVRRKGVPGKSLCCHLALGWWLGGCTSQTGWNVGTRTFSVFRTCTGSLTGMKGMYDSTNNNVGWRVSAPCKFSFVQYLYFEVHVYSRFQCGQNSFTVKT